MPSEVRQFKAKLVGVTFSNADGRNRQDLLRSLSEGEALLLRPEPQNPVDRFAIAVDRSDGAQLGYLPGGDYRLALHLDAGERARAFVVAVIGGQTDFDGALRSLGCVVQIEVEEESVVWAEVSPLLDRSRQIEKLLVGAKKLEENKPDKAIDRYKQALRQIVEFDSQGPVARQWRRARFPIARLSFLLERQGRFIEAVEAIAFYQDYGDAYGIPAEEQRSIAARKRRLMKRLTQ